jgi:Tfp pilus assembly protein PilF
MPNESWMAVPVLAVSIIASPCSVFAQHEHHGGTPGETLGTVSFQTSCQPAAQGAFNRAVALLHSFEFREAIAGFDAVLAADPACAMAHWGKALAYWSNPFAPGLKTGKLLQDGSAAAEAARATGTPTPRERAFIDAVAELYRGAGTTPQRERTLAYERAMERVAREHPDDMEATIFYALAITQDALPTDKTYANQLKAAALLEPLFAKHPEHPGLAHYLIHAYDSPPLAPKALDAARRYAKIAPSAPHALHMPSHTFTRLGYWQDSIETNIASADAAVTIGSYSEALHAMDYQMYAYLQTAQDAAARRILDRVPEVGPRLLPNAVTGAAPPVAGYYARAAIPARYALERGSWQEAAALPVLTSPAPYADAITHFARAIGAARSGHPEQAGPDIEQLAAIRDGLAKSGDTYWSGQVDIQWKSAGAWSAFASGRRDEAIAAQRAGADAEDASDKAAVTPGPLAPAREMLAEMLLEAGRPKEALAEFTTTLTHEPNRFRTIAGAARAAEAAGDAATAAKFSALLVDVCRHADTDRPDLRNAKTKSGMKTGEQ